MIDYLEIPLSQGKVALIDSADYKKIAAHKWHAHLNPPNGQFYAVTNTRIDGRRTALLMHREIMDVAPGDARKVDHKNPEETLDNRRGNLRIATPSQQCCNRRKSKANQSGYKGVRLHCSGKWQAQIKYNRVSIHLGTFTSPELAYAAYCDAAKIIHGEFARLA